MTDHLSPEASPDYAGLVRFLIAPFLESADALKVDCEIAPRPRRVLVRLAFEGEDKGRVFGRGGRNIQAVRTVLQAVAQTVGYTAHLEVLGRKAIALPPNQRDAPDLRGVAPTAHRPIALVICRAPAPQRDNQHDDRPAKR
ncbi:MAG: KH domain-containing protein [Leptolyngbyaceae cyanobacterium SM1_3_5]|nr:KH domain-containing protein [Leptolyngbyaceae cyanobacterium SM1_3_5]